MKNRFLLVSLLLIFCFFISGCSKGDYASNLKKVKAGMSEKRVYEIMGEPEDSYDMKDGVMIVNYWFKGSVSSMKEAEEKYNRGIPTTYYCVIVTAGDDGSFYVNESADIFSGVWHVE